MAEMCNPPKDRILAEFETMKSFELSAHDLYAKIAADPNVGSEKVRTAFASLVAEEQHHVDLVQEVISIISNAL